MLIELTDDMFKYHVMNYELGIQLDHPSKELYEETKKQILENQRIVKKTEEWKDQLEKEVAENDNKHARFILSCVNTILANAIVQGKAREN